MRIDTKPLDDGLAILKVSGNLTRASAVLGLSARLDQLHQEDRHGILLDLSSLKRLNMSGLAALVELAARNPKAELGFCGLPSKNLAFLRKSGLDRGLRIFPTVKEAQEDAQFRSFCLTRTKTVLLCAGKGSRIAPLSDIAPKPMLDIAGRPTLHRLLDHLSLFGLRDILLNPGHLGHQIIDYFQKTPIAGTRIGFVNEGGWEGDAWRSDPIGSASTLKRMQDATAAFDGDIVVLCGDALVDIDLVAMMRAHRASGAAATIAAKSVASDQVHKYGIIEARSDNTITRFVEKPAAGVTESRLANTGIYIFKASVLSLISKDAGLDIACDLLPAIIASNQTLHVHNADFAWVDIGCGRDYMQAVRLCLRGEIPFAKPMGEEIRPGVWAMPGAKVSRRAKILGPCHIGANARIEAGAYLEGVCAVGAGATVQKGAHLTDTAVTAGTHVRSGVWSSDMILHSDWAVNHTTADGSTQTRDQLKDVSATAPDNDQPLERVA